MVQNGWRIGRILRINHPPLQVVQGDGRDACAVEFDVEEVVGGVGIDRQRGVKPTTYNSRKLLTRQLGLVVRHKSDNLNQRITVSPVVHLFE